mmetsp:Transcript_65813/g.207892  ORF Transcript_65813/g.207892 Transcript_65813/m.207892 type:complete len:239 (+) Transcript_65813:458-1174(+)
MRRPRPAASGAVRRTCRSPAPGRRRRWRRSQNRSRRRRRRQRASGRRHHRGPAPAPQAAPAAQPAKQGPASLAAPATRRGPGAQGRRRPSQGGRGMRRTWGKVSWASPGRHPRRPPGRGAKVRPQRMRAAPWRVGPSPRDGSRGARRWHRRRPPPGHAARRSRSARTAPRAPVPGKGGQGTDPPAWAPGRGEACPKRCLRATTIAWRWPARGAWRRASAPETRRWRRQTRTAEAPDRA